MVTASIALSTPQTTEYQAEDILSFLFQNGSINVDDVESAMKQLEIERIIKDNHNYKIFQDKDGRWKTYVKDDTKKSGRRLIAKSTREKLNNALYDFYAVTDNEDCNDLLTMEDMFPEWLEMKELHGATSSYIRKINYHWSRYYSGSDIVTIPIKLLSKKQLDVWVHKTIDEFKLTRKEYTNMTVIVRGILVDAVDSGIIDINPFERIKVNPKKFKKVKKHDDLDQVFTQEEMAQIEIMAWAEIHSLTIITSKKQYLIPLAVLFQFQTGIRVCELAALRYEDILPDNKGLLVQRMYRFESQEIDEYTKGSYGDRVVPLTTEAIELIKIAKQLQEKSGLPSDGYIFSVTEKPACYNVFYNKYMEYCKRLDTKKKATHSARRTFVSALLSNQVNLNTVRKACGHVDEKTTLHNYCYDMSTEDKKTELIEKALDWRA